MSKTKELKVKITADIKNFNNAIDGISQGTAKAAKSFSGITKAGQALQSVGGSLVKGVTLPLTAAGAASVKLYTDFDSSMKGVAATMGMTSQEIESGSESYKKLEAAAKEMGASTQFSAKESADALNYLALAGYDVDKSISMLPKVLDLAAAGGLDLAYASDLATDAASALGLDIKGTEVLIDQMAKTSQKSNTSVGQLGEAILTVGGTAKMLAGGTTELNTCLGILADNGIKGAEGGTALRNVILSLTAPTDQAAAAMEDLGLQVFDSEGKMRPLNETLADLDGKLAQMTDEEKINVLDTIFNKVDLKSVNALLANSGDRFKDLSSNIENSDGAASKMADTMNSGLGGAFKEMNSALEGAAIAAGEVLAPMIKNLAELIKDLSSWFTKLSPNAQQFVVIAGLIAAVIPIVIVAVGGLMVAFGGLASASVALQIGLWPLTLIMLAVVAAIAAVVAIGAFLIANWDEIKAAAVAMGERISEAWNNLKQWTIDTYNGIKDAIVQAWEAVKQKFSETWNKCVEFVSTAWDWICQLVQTGIQFVADLIGLAIDIITLPFRFIWENCKEIVATAWEAICGKVSEWLGKISDGISQAWDAIVGFTKPIWDGLTGWIGETWSKISSKASEKFNEIKTKISDKWNEIKTKTSETWGNITSWVSGKWDEIKSKASEKFSSIKDKVSSAWSDCKSKTDSTWNSIKDKIGNKINEAKDKVKQGVDKLKSFMNFSWSLPKLKMPHFSITGKFSLNPPSAPKFGINWYSKGGIFKKPTVLGGIGVGDKHRGAGSNMEAVLPLNKLPELLGLDKNDNKGLAINIDSFVNNTDYDIEQLCDRIAFELKRRRV